MNRLISTIVLLCFVCVSEKCTKAGLIITISESGSDVIANGGGTLNISALIPVGVVTSGTLAAGIDPSVGDILIGATSGTEFDGYLGASGTFSIGPGNFTAATSSSGDFFFFDAIQGGFFVLPKNYASGSTLTSQAVWANQTLATLGVTPGSYTWTWGTDASADFFTINAITAVPEPSSFALVALGLTALFRRRRA